MVNFLTRFALKSYHIRDKRSSVVRVEKRSCYAKIVAVGSSVICDLMDTTRRIMHEVSRGSCVTWWIQPGGSCMKSPGGHVWPDGYNQEDHAWSHQGVTCDLMDTTRRIMHEVTRGSCVTWWIQPGGSCMKSPGGHLWPDGYNHEDHAWSHQGSCVTWWIQPGGSCMKSPGGHLWPDGYNQEDHAWSHQGVMCDLTDTTRRIMHEVTRGVMCDLTDTTRRIMHEVTRGSRVTWWIQPGWSCMKSAGGHVWPDGYNQEDHAWSHQGVMCDLMDTTRRIMHEVTRGSCVTWWIQPGGSCMKSPGGHVWPDGYNQEDHAWSHQGVMCDLMDTTRRIMHEVTRGSFVTWWIQPWGSCMKSPGVMCDLMDTTRRIMHEVTRGSFVTWWIQPGGSCMKSPGGHVWPDGYNQEDHAWSHQGGSCVTWRIQAGGSCIKSPGGHVWPDGYNQEDHAWSHQGSFVTWLIQPGGSCMKSPGVMCDLIDKTRRIMHEVTRGHVWPDWYNQEDHAWSHQGVMCDPMVTTRRIMHEVTRGSCVTWWIQPGGSCMKSPWGHVWPDGYNQEDHAWSHPGVMCDPMVTTRRIMHEVSRGSCVTWWIQPGGSSIKSAGGHVWPNGYNQEDHAWSHQGVMCDPMDTTRRIMHEVTMGSYVTQWIQPGGSCMKSPGGHVWPNGYNQEDHARSHQGVMCDLMDTTRRFMHEVTRGSCVTWWIQPGGSCMKSPEGHVWPDGYTLICNITHSHCVSSSDINQHLHPWIIYNDITPSESSANIWFSYSQHLHTLRWSKVLVTLDLPDYESPRQFEMFNHHPSWIYYCLLSFNRWRWSSEWTGINGEMSQFSTNVIMSYDSKQHYCDVFLESH